jgi:hypothetical protein
MDLGEGGGWPTQKRRSETFGEQVDFSSGVSRGKLQGKVCRGPGPTAILYCRGAAGAASNRPGRGGPVPLRVFISPTAGAELVYTRPDILTRAEKVLEQGTDPMWRRGVIVRCGALDRNRRF